MSEIAEEYLVLAKENRELLRKNKRLTKRSNELGLELLKAKNEVRDLKGDWKQFNKDNRNAQG